MPASSHTAAIKARPTPSSGRRSVSRAPPTVRAESSRMAPAPRSPDPRVNRSSSVSAWSSCVWAVTTADAPWAAATPARKP